MLYLKPNRRRPVRFRPLSPGEDSQAAVPYGWCWGCGSEVFAPGEQFCNRCKEANYESTEPLYPMYACTQPGPV